MKNIIDSIFNKKVMVIVGWLVVLCMFITGNIIPLISLVVKLIILNVFVVVLFVIFYVIYRAFKILLTTIKELGQEVSSMLRKGRQNNE